MKRTAWLVGLATTGILITLIAIVPAGRARQNAAAEIHGINLADLDRTCKPCEDFYKFVNGGWMTRNPIPAAYPSWGRFSELSDHNQETLRKILEEAAASKSPAPGSVEQKIGDFYASCIDTAKIDAAGIHPLDDELARIAKISDVASLQAEVAHLQSEGLDVMFAFGSEQDFKNSAEQTGGVQQAGLGLPDREYYSNPDDKSKGLRDGYHKHLVKMFGLMGDSATQSASEADAVMAIETKLAAASKTRVEMRDPESNYHRMNVKELETLTPHFSWPAYFQSVGFSNISAVNVGQPEFVKQLDARLADVSLADWKTYLRWHLIHGTAAYLSTPFVDENFDFFGRTLSGTKELRPRWKRCVSVVDGKIGEALGRKYVERAFPPEAKARALEMIHNLIDALRDDLKTLPWMSPATREQAIIKLNAITIKVGYPDKWRDYSALTVDRGPYVLNVLRGDAFEFHRDLTKIGAPVDHGEWTMTPPTVDAYYNPQLNEIVFPAGVLQHPFFDAKADDPLNYGGIGAAIGHEMTHGFDDQGRQFDAQGNLRDWWTADDAKNFEARAECIIKQFDSYTVQGDLHENGKLVVGESIADLGGLTIAFAALEKSRAGKPGTLIDGFTPEQRFFISFGTIWGESNRPEYERMMVTLNEHPFGRYRVLGVISNMPSFAAAYSCKPGEPMVRQEDQRCRIW